jgi:hypothetical protein
VVQPLLGGTCPDFCPLLAPGRDGIFQGYIEKETKFGGFLEDSHASLKQLGVPMPLGCTGRLKGPRLNSTALSYSHADLIPDLHLAAPKAPSWN